MPAKMTKPAARKNPTTPAPLPTDDQIRQRAFEIYEARGRQGGSEQTDWETAVQELTSAPVRKRR